MSLYCRVHPGHSPGLCHQEKHGHQNLLQEMDEVNHLTLDQHQDLQSQANQQRMAEADHQVLGLYMMRIDSSLS